MIKLIGLLVSEDVARKDLEQFGEKSNYQMKLIQNVKVEKKRGVPVVKFFHAARTGECVQEISIGSYRLYSQDVSYLLDETKLDKGCTPEVMRSLYYEVQERNSEFEKDAKNWMELIKHLKYEKKVKELGIFWADDDYIVDPTDIEIFELEYVECTEEELSEEYLMKIPIETLVMFV